MLSAHPHLPVCCPCVSQSPPEALAMSTQPVSPVSAVPPGSTSVTVPYVLEETLPLCQLLQRPLLEPSASLGPHAIPRLASRVCYSYSQCLHPGLQGPLGWFQLSLLPKSCFLPFTHFLGQLQHFSQLFKSCIWLFL